MIKAILAVDDNNGIAKDGKIPWHNKEDFAFFKETTIGNGKNIIVMGRKTKETLPKAGLPNRINMIMTRTPKEVNEINNWNQVIELDEMADDVFIIGGGSIYDQTFDMMLAEEVYVSRIFGNYECDQFADHVMDVLKLRYEQVDKTAFETFSLETWKRK